MCDLTRYLKVQIMIVLLTCADCYRNCSTLMTMIPKDSLKDKLILDGALWTRGGSGSPAGCASDCGLDVRCVSFFYNAVDDICTAHDMQVSAGPLAADDPGSLFYTLDIGKF